jgi:hypothetical protein
MLNVSTLPILYGRGVRVLILALGLLLPNPGVLVPGKSLGGVSLGMTHAQVRAHWGDSFGHCRGCAQETWYFNYNAFHPEGAAVRFAKGRVDAVWTLWQPAGWRTTSGLLLDVPAAEINVHYGTLVTITCGSVQALIRTKGRVTSVFYVFNGKVWGFGLTRPGVIPCH